MSAIIGSWGLNSNRSNNSLNMWDSQHVDLWSEQKQIAIGQIEKQTIVRMVSRRWLNIVVSIDVEVQCNGRKFSAEIDHLKTNQLSASASVGGAAASWVMMNQNSSTNFSSLSNEFEQRSSCVELKSAVQALSKTSHENGRRKRWIHCWSTISPMMQHEGEKALRKLSIFSPKFHLLVLQEAGGFATCSRTSLAVMKN